MGEQFTYSQSAAPCVAGDGPVDMLPFERVVVYPRGRVLGFD